MGMFHLFLVFLLFQGSFSVDLEKFFEDKNPEDITSEDASAFLEAIQNSETPEEDLARYRAHSIKNAKSEREKKLAGTMSDLLEGMISLRNAMGLDSKIIPMDDEELEKLMSPNGKKIKAATDANGKVDVDIFDSHVQEMLKALPIVTESFKNKGKLPFVLLNEEEKIKELHRIALKYYKTLYPDESPTVITDEIMEDVLEALESVESADVPDAAAEKAAKEFGAAMLLLEKGMKANEDVDLEGVAEALIASGKFGNKPKDTNKSKQREVTKCKSEIFIDNDSGRRYCLVEMNENELEMDDERITLNYYHSLFPEENRPTKVTDEINDKLFAALKSIDISNHKKTKAQNEFQEELELHEKGLRKQYLSKDESKENWKEEL